jgi:hypothetical protein
VTLEAATPFAHASVDNILDAMLLQLMHKKE